PRGGALVRNYAMEPRREGDAAILTFAQDQFVPAGDLTIDYQPVDHGAELVSWTYQGAAPAAPPTSSREGDRAVLAAQRAIAADARPFVALSLRPRLPPWTESRPRDYVLVVDSSASMVGGRYLRASALASGL